MPHILQKLDFTFTFAFSLSLHFTFASQSKFQSIRFYMQCNLRLHRLLYTGIQVLRTSQGSARVVGVERVQLLSCWNALFEHTKFLC